MYLNTIRISCVSISVDQKEGKLRNTENFKLMNVDGQGRVKFHVRYCLMKLKKPTKLLLSEVGRTVFPVSCVDLQLNNDPCQTSSAHLVSPIA